MPAALLPVLLRYALPALAVVGLLWGAIAHLDNDRDTRKALGKLRSEADNVTLAIEHATGEKAEWSTVPGQIIALGEANRALKTSIADQNRAIDDMAREAVRLKARAKELKAIADKAQAQRKSALARLSDLSITPGTRSDCMTLLREAEEALNLVREAGI